MKVSLVYYVEVDDKEYPALSKSQIRGVIRGFAHNEGCIEYLGDRIRTALEELNGEPQLLADKKYLEGKFKSRKDTQDTQYKQDELDTQAIEEEEEE